MTKLFRTLALAVLLAGATGAVSVAPAQEKGKTTKKEDDKKEAKKGKKAGGSVEVLENKAGKFYFKIVNADGKMLAMSPVGGFAEKADAVKALETLKEILDTAKVTYPPRKADDDKDEKKETKKKDEKKKG